MPTRLSRRLQRRATARDLARRMAELDRLDRERGLGAMPPPRTGRGRRSHGALLPSLLVSGVVLAGGVVFSPNPDIVALRRMVGLGDDERGPVPIVAGEGTYAFLQTQLGSDAPVGYDPCSPVEVLVNPEGAPADYDDLVDTGLAHVGEATGLRLVRVGLSDDRDVSEVSSAPRPVLIMWATPEEVPELAGDVAGLGGSAAAGPPGRLHYVTGRIVLDRDVFAEHEGEGTPYSQAIVDHELGHLVGLAHVDSPDELMYHDNVGRLSYGIGDRQGLARLGSTPC